MFDLYTWIWKQKLTFWEHWCVGDGCNGQNDANDFKDHFELDSFLVHGVNLLNAELALIIRLNVSDAFIKPWKEIVSTQSWLSGCYFHEQVPNFQSYHIKQKQILLI